MALVKIKNTNGELWSYELKTDLYLADIRMKLEADHKMDRGDFFLNEGARITRDSEKDITLCELLNGKKEIEIGTGQVIGADVTFSMFPALSNDEKISFFQQSQLTRGITFSEEGVERSFYNLFTLKAPPSMAKETVNTKMESSYTFSKTTRDINLLTSERASVSFHAPFASAKAEYEYEKNKRTSSSEIKEYLLSKFIVSQAQFQIELSSMEVNMDFYRAVSEAVNSDWPDHRRMRDLMETLNVWGLYVPLKFVMGGVLYTSDEKKISDFKQSETDKENFSAAAKAAFEGFGAGVDIGGSSSTGEETGATKEFKNLSVKQIGGIPGNITNNKEFADTLKYISAWEIVNIKKFYPSLMLLRNVKEGGKKSTLLRDALGLINENYYIDAVKELQPYVNMLGYATAIEEFVSPF